MTFNECLDFVFAQEGGDRLVNDPKDPGGLTKYGIAEAYHPGVDVKNLTRDEAARIYKAQYWDVCRCDELPAMLRLAVLDAAVNVGCAQAIRFLQRGVGVGMDGRIGAQTLDAAQKASSLRTLAQMLAERICFYGTREGFSAYGRGWVRRCLDLQQTVLGINRI
jgi:lysozyme family protein